MRRDKTRSGSRSLMVGGLVVAFWLALPGMLAAQADVIPPDTVAPAPNPPARAAQPKSSASQNPPPAAPASSAPNASPATSSQPQTDHSTKVKQAAAASASPAPAPPAVPAPPPPDWPINDKPEAATVVWDSQGLRIEARNSSLEQILKDVSTDTGATVEGLNGDQRVFGTYGPGPARQVLSDLLDGTGYNVLMFGDQGAGTPREIVLSAPPTGPAPANNNRSLASEEDYEPEPQPEPEQPVQPQYQPQAPQPGTPPRTPQQILQEMQQRQQQMQQQQQQQQPQNENQPPNNEQ